MEAAVLPWTARSLHAHHRADGGPSPQRTSIIHYTVQSATMYPHRHQFGLDVSTILWSNRPGRRSDMLSIGQNSRSCR